MMWASPSPAEPPAVEELNSRLSPPGAVLPTMVHCWVGAAFQRMMPPNRLSPRLILPSVTVFDGVGPVAAATKVTTGAVSAAVAKCIGPSECGAASVVGVVSKVEARQNSIAATMLDVALPENRISSTSVICVPLAPLTPIHEGVPGVPMALPAAFAVQLMAALVKMRFAILFSRRYQQRVPERTL